MEQPVEHTGDGTSSTLTSTTPVSAEAPSAPRNKLSCDACRIRKVGCDRHNPCARCNRLGVLCKYSFGYKARPKRAPKPPTSTAAGVTTDSERGVLEAKIDHLTERLSQLFVFLEDPKHETRDTYEPGASASAPAPAPASSCGHGPDTASSWPTGQPEKIHTNTHSPFDDEDDDDGESQHRGDSSLAAHASFATDVLESALRSDSAPSRSAEVEIIIQNVRNTIRRPAASTSTPQPSSAGTPHPGFGPRQLPPVQLTLDCLRLLKTDPAVSELWSVCFDSVGQATGHLLNLYSLQTDPSRPELIIAHIGLHFLFLSCARTATTANVRARYLDNANACQENADAVLAQLPFHLPTTVECVLAMTLAVEYCLSQCKIVTAWTYVTVATRMSKALGLHRVACERAHGFNAEDRQNSKLFWTLYILEKNLSLQVGRSSTISENDITIPLSDVRMGSEWGATLGFLSPKWMRSSQIVGSVYEDLYSPLAMTLPLDERAARAARLLEALQRVEDEEDPSYVQFLKERRKALGVHVDNLLTRYNLTAKLGLICLIQRSVTVGTASFSEQCIATAREALAYYTETISLGDAGNSFFFELCTQWSLLVVSCAPFFVILCSAIWTLQATDLQLLGAFVASLETAAGKDSPSATYLLRSFRPLHDAAERYFELKNRQSSAAASSECMDPVSFSSIYDDMVPEMSHESFLPMQWQAVPLLQFDQPGSAMGGNAYGANFGHF